MHIAPTVLGVTKRSECVVSSATKRKERKEKIDRQNQQKPTMAFGEITFLQGSQITQQDGSTDRGHQRQTTSFETFQPRQLRQFHHATVGQLGAVTVGKRTTGKKKEFSTGWSSTAKNRRLTSRPTLSTTQTSATNNNRRFEHCHSH
jgi:hypothetical protein